MSSSPGNCGIRRRAFAKKTFAPTPTIVLNIRFSLSVQRLVDIKNRPRIPIPDEDPYSVAGNGGGSGGSSGSSGFGHGNAIVASPAMMNGNGPMSNGNGVAREQLLMQAQQQQQQQGGRRSEKPPKLPPRDNMYPHDIPKVNICQWPMALCNLFGSIVGSKWTCHKHSAVERVEHAQGHGFLVESLRFNDTHRFSPTTMTWRRRRASKASPGANRTRERITRNTVSIAAQFGGPGSWGRTFYDAEKRLLPRRTMRGRQSIGCHCEYDLPPSFSHISQNLTTTTP